MNPSDYSQETVSIVTKNLIIFENYCLKTGYSRNEVCRVWPDRLASVISQSSVHCIQFQPGVFNLADMEIGPL